MCLDEAGGVISRGFEGTVSDGVAESAVSDLKEQSGVLRKMLVGGDCLILSV